MALGPELQRRASATAAVLALFQSKPGQWLDWTEIAAVGGSCGWRTRIADARKIVAKEGGRIENRQTREPDRVISEYRYLAYQPLGRDASIPVSDHWPVCDAPSHNVFRLT